MKEFPDIKTIFVVGPTATGKTSLGISLARRFGGELISADSRQVYRRMDIGTGKDLQAYAVNGRQMPFHLIDIVEPSDEYNLMRYCRDFRAVMLDMLERKKLPVVVGGSVLYIDAVIRDYRLPGGPQDKSLRDSAGEMDVAVLAELLRGRDPQAFCALKDKGNRTRLIRALEISGSANGIMSAPPFKIAPLLIGTYFHRKEVHRRIESRLDERLANGMLEEVKMLHAEGLSWERLEYFGLEYRYLALHLQKKLSYLEMRSQLLARIRQFAKRQDAWFRKMENEGGVIHWIPEGDQAEAERLAGIFIEGGKLPEPRLRLRDIRYGPKTD